MFRMRSHQIQSKFQNQIPLLPSSSTCAYLLFYLIIFSSLFLYFFLLCPLFLLTNYWNLDYAIIYYCRGDEQINISLETTPVKDPCSPEKEMEEKMKSPPSPPLSCPGSPTLSSKRFSPLPLPAANAGPAVWHGIKGSNMKRHMHVNFLIDVPIDYDTAASVPATTASSSSSSSTPSHMQENTPHPQRSPRSPPFSPVISPRSPSRLSLTNSSLQSSEDALNAINSLQLPER